MIIRRLEFTQSPYFYCVKVVTENLPLSLRSLGEVVSRYHVLPVRATFLSDTAPIKCRGEPWNESEGEFSRDLSHRAVLEFSLIVTD